MAGGLEPGDLDGPVQPKPFCDLSPTLLLQSWLCPQPQPKAWEGAGGAIPLLWELWLCLMCL